MISSQTLRSGLRLRIQDEGEGPALLFVHGLGSTLETWALNVPALSSRARCVAPDLPGFGDSDLPTRYFTIDDFAACMFDLLDLLSIGEAAVVGSSIGALVALEMAARRPEVVTHLVLASPPGMNEETDARALLRLLRWIREDGRPRLATMEDVLLITPHASAEVMRLANLSLESARGFLSGIPAVATFEARSRISRVASPTLLVWGEADALVPAANAGLWQQQMERARLHILPDAGHAPYFDAAEEFNRILAEFLFP